MSKYIILTIYSSAICLVLTLLNSVSMLPDYSEAADVVFETAATRIARIPKNWVIR